MKSFVTSFRVLSRYLLFTVVNIIGLAISLACLILIAQYVIREKTVNHFATDIDRTYIMTMEEVDGKSWFWGIIDKTDPLDRKLLNNPFVECHTTFRSFAEDHINKGNSQFMIRSLATDSLFLKILPYPVVSGTHRMSRPTEALITEQLAERLFGEENPLGEKIIHSTGRALTIVGVMGEPSSKSFLNFDLLIHEDLAGMRGMPYDLVLLEPGTDPAMINNHQREFRESGQFASKTARFQLFPLKDLYFDERHNFPPDINLSATVSTFEQGNRLAVDLLSVTGFLILLIGIFNYIHLFTAILSKRGREFGLKKFFGASKGQIFRQIYMENLTMTLFALFLALFLTEVASKMLSGWLDLSLRIDTAFIFLFSIVVLGILPLILSIHPLFRVRSSNSYASPDITDSGKGRSPLRWMFLFMQYVVTFTLLISALYFVKQLRFMLHTDHGYQTENVIMCRMMHRDFSGMGNNDYATKMQLIDENVARIEQKMNQSVLFSDWLFGKPVYDLEATVPFRRSDGDEYENIKLVGMSPAYLQMFGFELIEGRLWDSTDIHNPERLILNEAARDLFHITDIQMERIMPERSLTRDAIIQSYEIAGIIRNFQTGHLSKTPTPIAICFKEQGHHYDYLMARFIPGRKDEAVTFLKNLYREINGNRSFSYSTLDEKIAELYVEDRRVSNVNNLFALLAVVISCMGLFAISLFDMQQRKREIALRKINGASAKDVMLLLLKQYLGLLGISFAVAAPLSYWFIGRYMEHFAHATPISCWLFVLAGLLVTVLSLSTLFWQIQQAMRTNPSTVLKEG